MADLFTSPSRKYVINYKSKLDGQENFYELNGLSEIYVNDVTGAAKWFNGENGSIWTLISCVPRELHLEHIKEQEKLYKCNKMMEDLKEGIENVYKYNKMKKDLKEEQEKLPTPILSSPSRSYVVYVEEPGFPALERHYLVILPDDWENDEIEGVRYLYEKILPRAKVSNCLTYENYLKLFGSRLLSPYRYIIVGTFKGDTSISEWHSIKLVTRYKHREKRPKIFLFSMPRIFLKSLEEELTRQANVSLSPDYKYGWGYHLENNYSVVFRLESSGFEDVVSYHPYKLHGEVAVFFDGLMAIFGRGVEDLGG